MSVTDFSAMRHKILNGIQQYVNFVQTIPVPDSQIFILQGMSNEIPISTDELPKSLLLGSTLLT